MQISHRSSTSSPYGLHETVMFRLKLVGPNTSVNASLIVLVQDNHRANIISKEFNSTCSTKYANYNVARKGTFIYISEFIHKAAAKKM